MSTHLIMLTSTPSWLLDQYAEHELPVGSRVIQRLREHGDRGPTQLVRGEDAPARQRQRADKGGQHQGQKGGLSEEGREHPGRNFMKEGLGDHILLLRLFQVLLPFLSCLLPWGRLQKPTGAASRRPSFDL